MNPDAHFPDLQTPPAGESPLKSNRSKAILMVVLVIVLGLGFYLWRRESNARLPRAPRIVTVAAAKVIRENLVQEQSFDAEFRPYQEIDLHAKVAGFVKEIRVDIGDRVKAGELLAVLEIPELAEDLEKAEAQRQRATEEQKRASAAYDETHLVYERIQAVNKAKPQLIAQQELDEATGKDQTAAASVSSAQQEVAVATAEIKKLQAMQDYCRIIAPFAGVITKRFADEGALVQGGVSPSASAMPLVRLSEQDVLRLDFPVSITCIPYVHLGDEIDFKIQGEEKKFSGKIVRFSRNVDMSTRTMIVEAEVKNPGLRITPGIYASATLKLAHGDNVLTVPVSALSQQKHPSVYVINSKQEIEDRPVVIGLETPDRVEIKEGVAENELVMIGNRTLVKPGQTVEPKLIEMNDAY